MTVHNRFISCLIGPVTVILAVLAFAGPVAAATDPAVVTPTTQGAAPTAGSEGTSSSAPGTARMATEQDAITNEGSERSKSGQYVFVGICAVIVVGAASLFLKYRNKPAQS